MPVIGVTRFRSIRQRSFFVVFVQIVHDDVHRHRRAEEREDDESSEANGRARHRESVGAKPRCSEVYPVPIGAFDPRRRVAAR